MMNNNNYNNKFLGHSNIPTPINLTPGFVTGLADGEGSFGIYLQKTAKNQQTGYQVKYEFTIVLHDRDRTLLENVQLFFNGIGGIDKHGKTSSKYRVSSIKDLSIIIDHFDKYPLLTQKRANYLLFKRAFERLSGGLARAPITNPNLQLLTMRGWLKISVRGIHTLPNPSVKVYNNADLQKKQILLENKEKSGVYR